MKRKLAEKAEEDDMFYRLSNGMIEQAQQSVPATDGAVSVGCVTLEELKENYQELGLEEAVVEECLADISHFRTGLSVYDDYSLGIISVVDLRDVTGVRDSIGFVVKKDRFLVINISDEDNSIVTMLEAAMGRFKRNLTVEKVMYGMFDALLKGGGEYLGKTEERILEFERLVAEGKINTGINRTIFSMRNRLAVMKNYYEQLADIGDQLQGNENNVFDQQNLRYFKIFADKAGRFSRNTTALLESLIHLREAVDAALNYSLNSVMKLFTVVTTIFLPLTLIVGWYGMNFTNMPELTWRYGYLFVILLSVAVVVVTIGYFKKKKLL